MRRFLADCLWTLSDGVGAVAQAMDPRSATIVDQVLEDTCVTHGLWCCPECFDMSPASVVVPLRRSLT